MICLHFVTLFQHLCKYVPWLFIYALFEIKEIMSSFSGYYMILYTSYVKFS